MRQPILISWSGGKDSLLALERLLQTARWEVAGLLTVVTQEDQRVSMHGVPRRLIEQQAEALGYELATMTVPRWPSNDVYEAALQSAVAPWLARGVTTMAFGDLFLAEIRVYREALCAGLGVTPVFPLWGEETSQLAAEFVERGYRAIVCCADARVLETADFVGCGYDASFLRRLPAGVDPCGERGEFHTLVVDGPRFRFPVPVTIGRTQRVEPFWYAEIEAANEFDTQSAESVQSVRESVDV